MNIAIYSAFYSTTSITYIKSVIDYLEENKHDFILVDRLKKHLGSEADKYNYYKDDKPLNQKIDFVFSVGGDGTLLRSISIIRDTKIPILGINAGNLGIFNNYKT